MIWWTVFLTLVATVGLYFLQDAVAGKMKKQNLTKEENSLQQHEMWLADAKVDYTMALDNGDAIEIAEMEATVERMEESVERVKALLVNYEENQWKAILQDEIETLSLFLTPEASFAIEGQGVNPFTLRASKEALEWLIENDIEPFVYDLAFGFFHPTIYDNFTGRALKWWKKLSKQYGEEGLYYLYQMMPHYLAFIILLIGIFIFGNSIALESRRKKHELSFYFVQPVGRWSVFFAKYFTGLAATILFFLSVLLMPILASVFTKGIGSLKYPVLVYEGAIPNAFDEKYTSLSAENDQFHFITMGEYAWKVIVLALVAACFLYGLYLFVSFFIKSPPVILILVTGLSVSGLRFLPVSKWNPWIYLDFHRIVNGETAALAIEPSIHFQTGLIVVGLVGIGLMGVNAVIFRWKKI